MSKEILEQYWMKLVEGLGSVRNQNKIGLIKSLEALSYYNSDSKIDLEQFDRMMATINYEAA